MGSLLLFQNNSLSAHTLLSRSLQPDFLFLSRTRPWICAWACMLLRFCMYGFVHLKTVCMNSSHNLDLRLGEWAASSSSTTICLLTPWVCTLRYRAESHVRHQVPMTPTWICAWVCGLLHNNSFVRAPCRGDWFMVLTGRTHPLLMSAFNLRDSVTVTARNHQIYLLEMPPGEIHAPRCILSQSFLYV